jgi:hypothetical protein
MDYSVDVDGKHEFVRINWVRDVTAPALETLWQELRDNPLGAATFDTLIDLRAVHVAMTAAEIRAIAELAKRQPSGRRAIVVSTDVDYGLMRMLELMAEPGPRVFAVFRSMDDACLWLGNPACAEGSP